MSRRLYRLPSRTVIDDFARQSLYVPVVINDPLPGQSVISRRPDVDKIPSGLLRTPIRQIRVRPCMLAASELNLLQFNVSQATSKTSYALLRLAVYFAVSITFSPYPFTWLKLFKLLWAITLERSALTCHIYIGPRYDHGSLHWAIAATADISQPISLIALK